MGVRRFVTEQKHLTNHNGGTRPVDKLEVGSRRMKMDREWARDSSRREREREREESRI